MADTWNQAAEAQELTESVQRLVRPRKKCDLRIFNKFTHFQSENINEVNLGAEIKPQTENVEEEK